MIEQKLNQKLGSLLLTGLFLDSFSGMYLSLKLRPTCLRKAPPTVGWSLQYRSAIKKTPCKTCPHGNLCQQFFSRGSSFRVSSWQARSAVVMRNHTKGFMGEKLPTHFCLTFKKEENVYFVTWETLHQVKCTRPGKIETVCNLTQVWLLRKCNSHPNHRVKECFPRLVSKENERQWPKGKSFCC